MHDVLVLCGHACGVPAVSACVPRLTRLRNDCRMPKRSCSPRSLSVPPDRASSDGERRSR
eukprot:2852186-Pleurochrysis_carterae.AAC.1